MENLLYWVGLAAVAVFMAFPLAFSLYMSFQRWDLFSSPSFVGATNYRDLFTGDPLFGIGASARVWDQAGPRCRA